jgi:uncharacterized RDD family membrane protein YckC
MESREPAMNNPYAPPPPSPPNPYANPYQNPQQNPYGNPYANPQAGSPYSPGPGPGGFNPYAPPSSQSDHGYGYGATQQDGMLAERGTRLGAALIDAVLYIAAFMIGAMPGFMVGDEFVIGAGAIFAWIALVAYQWYLISTSGQTLAKKWLGIRIVRVDGSQLGFLYGVVLRSWVMGFAAGLIPFVGLVDVLLIFGDERRCLHDHLAGTKVVVASD